MQDKSENGGGLGDAVKQSIEWVTRILAVCAIMGLMVWGGTQLDARLGSNWFTPIGVVVGILFGMSGMILVVKRMELIQDGEKRTTAELGDRQEPKELEESEKKVEKPGGQI